MADISKGPVQSVPGTAVPPPDGQWCDWHADRPAIVRIQGETTSTGCEWHDCCSECCSRVLFSVQRFYPGQCQLCGHFKDDLVKWRDPAEGAAGPVYDACQECRDLRGQQYLAQEPLQAEVERNEVAEMIQEFDEVEEDPDAQIDAEVFGPGDDEDTDTGDSDTSD